jgi:hypothetical protein
MCRLKMPARSELDKGRYPFIPMAAYNKFVDISVLLMKEFGNFSSDRFVHINYTPNGSAHMICR